MTTERSLKQFTFCRGRVATPSQAIEDDRVVVRNIADKLTAGRLDRLLSPDLELYVRAVNELYAGLVEHGDISDAEKSANGRGIGCNCGKFALGRLS